MYFVSMFFLTVPKIDTYRWQLVDSSQFAGPQISIYRVHLFFQILLCVALISQWMFFFSFNCISEKLNRNLSSLHNLACFLFVYHTTISLLCLREEMLFCFPYTNLKHVYMPPQILYILFPLKKLICSHKVVFWHAPSYFRLVLINHTSMLLI